MQHKREHGEEERESKQAAGRPWRSGQWLRHNASTTGAVQILVSGDSNEYSG